MIRTTIESGYARVEREASEARRAETSALLSAIFIVGTDDFAFAYPAATGNVPVTFGWLGGSELLITQFETQPFGLLLRNLFPFGAL